MIHIFVFSLKGHSLLPSSLLFQYVFRFKKNRNTSCEKRKKKTRGSGVSRCLGVSVLLPRISLMGVDSPRPVSHALCCCTIAHRGARSEAQKSKEIAFFARPAHSPHLTFPSPVIGFRPSQHAIASHHPLLITWGPPPADPTVIYNPIITQGIVTPASHAREPSRYHMQVRLWAHTPSPTTSTCNLFPPHSSSRGTFPPTPGW